MERDKAEAEVIDFFMASAHRLQEELYSKFTKEERSKFLNNLSLIHI